MENTLFTLSVMKTIKRFLEQQEFESISKMDDFEFMSEIGFSIYRKHAKDVIELLLHRNKFSQSVEGYELEKKNDNLIINQ